MRTQTIKLADIKPAEYNPRVTLTEKDQEYKALAASIEDNGLVLPLVVNIHNMRCVGGNQRLAVMRDMGIAEALCSIIDQPDEVQEKKLCPALNRIDGRWDTDKLGDLLRDDDVLEWETGFDEAEVRLYRQLEDAQEPDADDDAEDLDDLMVDLYYQMKRENGYTDDQIMAKRRSLENVLSPLEPAWNEAMLKQAGFRKVEMFWRCLNFCGWIAVK